MPLISIMPLDIKSAALLAGKGLPAARRNIKFKGNDRYIVMVVDLGVNCRVVPDIRPFFISGIWPDIRFYLPDIRLNC